MKPVLTIIAVILLGVGSAFAQNTERPPADPLAVKPVPAQVQTA